VIVTFDLSCLAHSNPIKRQDSFAGKVGRLLAAAAVAWSALSAGPTIHLEVSMKAHVELKVQGEAGVRVGLGLALQLFFPKISESMGNHDSNIVDACSVD
jgi:hypothetical protein